MKNNTLRSGGQWFGQFYQRFGISVIAIVLFIVSAIIEPVFLTPANLMNILRQVVVVTILVCGVQLVQITRNIDLSPSAMMAFTGCVGVLVMKETNSVLLGVLLAICLGGVLGMITGTITTTFGVPAFIVSLAMQLACKGFAYIMTGGTPIQLYDFEKDHIFTIIGQGYVGFIPVPVIIMAVVVLFTWFIVYKLQFGRHLLATGGNPAAAKAAGINTKSVVIRSYLFLGVLVGIAGMVLMSRLNSAQPSIETGGYEFKALTASIIGGTGLTGGVCNLFGTIVGSIFMGILYNIMNLANVSSYLQLVVQGVIIAFAVIVDAKVKKSTT